jgi:crossover junction endodeoxyribonuclease RusA
MLPWQKPLMSMNDRKHWSQRARLTRQMRETTRLLARGLPTELAHIEICLHYRPRDNRRRDTDNLMPVLKACADGIVDARVVPDDTPQYMTKRMPVIHPAEKGQPGSLWLTITIQEIPA